MPRRPAWLRLPPPSRALAAVVVFVAGMGTRGVLDSHPSMPSHGAGTPTRVFVSGETAQAGPTRTEAGMPAGFAHSEAGAVAAAVSYVCTGQALLNIDPIGVEQAVRAIAASGAADAQISDIEGKLAAARRALADGTGPIIFRQGAIAARVDAYTRERARVAVWNVGVLARAGVAPPQAGWSTSTFDLVWERADWKVWSETILPGPAPIPNDAAPPATAAELEAKLAGFADLHAGA